MALCRRGRQVMDRLHRTLDLVIPNCYHLNMCVPLPPKFIRRILAPKLTGLDASGRESEPY